MDDVLIKILTAIVIFIAMYIGAKFNNKFFDEFFGGNRNKFLFSEFYIFYADNKQIMRIIYILGLLFVAICLIFFLSKMRFV